MSDARSGNAASWLELVLAPFAASREAWTAALSPHAPERSPTEAPICQRWTTPNQVVRDLHAMRLRRFAGGRGPSAVIVAPFALHGASIVDFAPGHSVVEALHDASEAQVFVTEWRSAGQERRFDTIDTLLADLNVAIDDAGRGCPVALIGLCQGGWLAAAYCARFPRKVSRLALVGAPVDIAAARSPIADLAAATPPAAVEAMLQSSGGLVIGERMAALWRLGALTQVAAIEALQLDDAPQDEATAALVVRFSKWDETVVNLPGAFYRQTFDWIFRENRLAAGRFVALGETIDLRAIDQPLFLMTARDDRIVSPKQLLSIANLVGTRPDKIEICDAPGDHLSLFLGRRTLKTLWPRMATFLGGARRKPKRRKPAPR